MLNALVIAFGVGGATILGGVIGYFLKHGNERAEGAVFSFAAGVMLAASFSELIFPEIEAAGGSSLYGCIVGIITGGAVILVLQKSLRLYGDRVGKKLLPQMSTAGKKNMDGVLLFIAAIAVHNLPEGVAAGVGLGTGDLLKAIKIAAGIALQNIPEGMIVFLPLAHVGVQRKRALAVAVITGLIEIFGTFLGYFAVSAFSAVLPFAFCVTGGTMLYIIYTEVVEEANEMCGKQISGFSFLIGCCSMFLLEKLLCA